MANRTHSTTTKGFIIRFQEDNFRLSIETLKKQTDAAAAAHENWRSPCLRFLSFRKGQLTLMNSSGTRSFKLVIQVLKEHLLVNCSCGHNGPSLCQHAFAGLYKIIWHLGEEYFEKLQPSGLMEMAFAHKRYFDRQESAAGLDIIVRPELPSIFWLAPKVEDLNIGALLKLPSALVKREMAILPPPVNKDLVNTSRGLVYLFVIAAHNRLLPALIPCMGTLNKQQSAVKSFRQFLVSLQKESQQPLTNNQKFLNRAGYQLWKLVEAQPGHIVNGFSIKSFSKKLTAIFYAWQEIIPVLQRQPFIYSYYLYSVKELKGKPQRRRIKQISFSIQSPELRFVLKDRRHFYLLQMQVWVNNKLLPHCDTGATLFINHRQVFYLLGSLRDAAIAQWIHLSGECITIFKEHFAKFEKEILMPLRQCYSVSVTN